MTSIRKLSLRTTLYLLVFGSSLIPGSAAAHMNSPMAQGEFTLHSEVHWGTTVLPCGRYWISLDPLSPSDPLAIVRIGSGKRMIASFVSLCHLNDSSSGQGTLTLEHSGGITVVRALNLPEEGVVLYYSIPKTTVLMAHSDSSTLSSRSGLSPGN